jgi:ABC-type nickel/cobalt efflux system permease component RcnA
MTLFMYLLCFMFLLFFIPRTSPAFFLVCFNARSHAYAHAYTYPYAHASGLSLLLGAYAMRYAYDNGCRRSLFKSTHTHTHTHTHIHTHTHALTHAHTHTRTQAHTHSQVAQKLVGNCWHWLKRCSCVFMCACSCLYVCYHATMS